MRTDVKKIVLTALFASLIFVCTYFIKVPLVVGYAHLGDSLILAFSSVFGAPAIIAAALGSALADIIGGYAVYAVPTALIKALMAVIVIIPINCAKCNKCSKYSLYIKFILAELFMVVAYFITDSILFGISAALPSIFGNVLQGVFGVVVAFFIRKALIKINLK